MIPGLRDKTDPPVFDCPNADGKLQLVLAHSRLGAAIPLDQCDHCGSIWFDKFELFQVDEAEARAIDSSGKVDAGPGDAPGESQTGSAGPVDTASLRYPHGANDDPLCPRCRKPLRVFTDQNIHGNIQMLMCDACEGFWGHHAARACPATELARTDRTRRVSVRVRGPAPRL